MGKIVDNPVTNGFSGKLGKDLVFRQVDGETIFAKRTVIKATASAGQLEIRDKFAEATQFASAVLEIPQASQDYKIMAELQGMKSAYLAAVTDYLTLPKFGHIYYKLYKGNVGDLITITTKVPLKVVEIDVSIVQADGTVVEAGKAEARELKCRYTATVANAAVTGCTLKIVARDRQDQEVTFEKVL